MSSKKSRTGKVKKAVSLIKAVPAEERKDILTTKPVPANTPSERPCY